MLFPSLARFTYLSLPLLRLMLGIVFLSSGWAHMTKADERSKSIGMSKGFTLFLGAAEFSGALGVIFAFFTQLPPSC